MNREARKLVADGTSTCYLFLRDILSRFRAEPLQRPSVMSDERNDLARARATLGLREGCSLMSTVGLYPGAPQANGACVGDW
jgi:hypothetical protein